MKPGWANGKLFIAAAPISIVHVMIDWVKVLYPIMHGIRTLDIAVSILSNYVGGLIKNATAAKSSHPTHVKCECLPV